MKINKIALCILALGLTSQVNAGFKALTWHSRANCLHINESITWQFGKNQWLKTDSYHYAPGDPNKINHAKCSLSTGWENTWRSAEVHWTEGTGGWKVYGDHFILIDRNNWKLIGNTEAQDCQIYDGWWDQNPPNNNPKKLKPVQIAENLRKPGVHIVKEILSDIPKELISEEIERTKQIKAKGFFSKPSQDAIDLIKMSKPDYIDPTEKYETGLKPDLSTIKLAFKFNGIPDVESTNVVGYAVEGTYLNTADHLGWTGIVTYYKDNDLGMCQFTLDNMYLNKGSINLRDDIVTYDVKNNPTVITIEGNDLSGFSNTIEWYDNTFMKQLRCATPNFDKEIKSKLIKRANELEIYL